MAYISFIVLCFWLWCVLEAYDIFVGVSNRAIIISYLFTEVDHVWVVENGLSNSVEFEFEIRGKNY